MTLMPRWCGNPSRANLPCQIHENGRAILLARTRVTHEHTVRVPCRWQYAPGYHHHPPSPVPESFPTTPAATLPLPHLTSPTPPLPPPRPRHSGASFPSSAQAKLPRCPHPGGTQWAPASPTSTWHGTAPRSLSLHSFGVLFSVSSSPGCTDDDDDDDGHLFPLGHFDGRFPEAMWAVLWRFGPVSKRRTY
jgi:hypothetical protein